MRSFYSVLAALLVSACAGRQAALLPDVDPKMAQAEVEKQNTIFLTDYRSKLIHASEVFTTLALANVDSCPRANAVYTGMLTTTDGAFPPEQRAVARKVFGAGKDEVGETPWVYWVVPDSPAARAGIAVGDRIVAVDGIELGEGAGGQSRMQSLLRRHSGNSVAFAFERSGNPMTVAVGTERICDYGFSVRRSERINAFADGTNVEVTTGLLRFIESDDELALIVGHEMAHNTLGHRDSITSNAVAGGLLGATGGLLAAGPLGAAIGVGLAVQGATMGLKANGQEYESQADYVGTYYAARAGYNVSNAADVIRRFAILDPGAIHLQGGSHPSTALRFLAIEQTAEEIRNKRAAGEPVLPSTPNAVR